MRVHQSRKQQVILFCYKNYREIASKEVFQDTHESWREMIEKKIQWDNSNPEHISIIQWEDGSSTGLKEQRI